MGAQGATSTHRAGRGGHPTHKQHLNLHPLTGQGGVTPTSWMAKAAGCNAAASPHLITGRAGCSGTGGSKGWDAHPEYGAVSPPAGQAATQGQAQALATGWPRPHNYRVALICTKEKRRKTGHSLRSRDYEGTPLLRHAPKSSVPPREVQAKLQHLCGGLKGKLSLSITPQTHTRKGRGTRTHRCDFPEGKDNAAQPTPGNKPTTTGNRQEPVTCP